jgi:hypothetical protein
VGAGDKFDNSIFRRSLSRVSALLIFGLDESGGTIFEGFAALFALLQIKTDSQALGSAAKYLIKEL